MPRLILALVRHGEYQQQADTPSAHQPYPLTPQGEAQAHGASSIIEQDLRRFGCELEPIIDSSNLLRGWQTATILQRDLQRVLQTSLEVSGFDALAERCLGSAANLTLEQIRMVIAGDPRFAMLPDGWKSDSQFRLPLQGAESLLQAGERVANHLQDQSRKAHAEMRKDSLKIVVGHGAAFRHAAFHLGVLEFEQIARLSMHHAQPVYLLFDGSRWSHLAGAWKLRGRQDAVCD